MELEHPALPGVGIDDELAVGESSIEVDGTFTRNDLNQVLAKIADREPDLRLAA